MNRLHSCLFVVALLVAVGEARAAVIADARADFVAGVNQGDQGIVTTATGEWRYLASDTANPTLDSSLDVLAWDIPTSVYRRATTGGSFNQVGLGITGLAADELGLHPSASSRPPGFALARWVVGAGQAGTIDIVGNVRLTDVTGSGSVSFDLFVDGVSLLGSSAVINDLVGSAFDHTVAVSVGSTVDFVVGANGGDSFDSTGLRASISSVPEPATGVLMSLALLAAGRALRRPVRPGR